MKPRILLPLLGVAALLVGTGIAVQIASATERPALSARYDETGSWTGGLIGAFTIDNPTNDVVADWKLSFGLPGDAKVVGVWNAKLATSNDGYTVSPTAETKAIAAHRSVVVGFTALATAHTVPVNCVINGKDCKVDVQPASADVRSDAGQPHVTASNAAALGAKADRTDADAPKPADGAPAGQPDTTALAPFVDLATGDRPPLKALAAGSGARLLTLLGAVPSTGGGCELTWGGTAGLNTYAKEVTDTLADNVQLVVSVGAAGGVDLARVCGSAAALEAQLKRVVDLGVRSIDLVVDNGPAADPTLDVRRALAVKALKANVPGLTVSYTLVGAATGLLTAPLSAAQAAGAVIDRVNLLPAQLRSPLAIANPLLANLGLAGTADDLLATATTVHDQIMKIQGVDGTTAWHRLGIVPVLGGKDLAGGTVPTDTVRKLVAFAKANGLGLLGLLPLGTGAGCAGSGLAGLPLGIPLLSCLDVNVLPNLFAITETFNRALR